MRLFLGMLLLTIGPVAAATSASAQSAPTIPSRKMGNAVDAAARQAANPVFSERVVFILRCLQNLVPASESPSPEDTAYCQTTWHDAQPALPIADALLTLASYDEEATLARARAAFPRTTWRPPAVEIASEAPDALLAARLADRDVILHGEEGVVTRISFQSPAPRRGEDGTRPWADWLAALIVRRATVSEIGCARVPVEEFMGDAPIEMVAISVEPPEGRPLLVLEQVISGAGAQSLVQSIELGGAIPTLSDLRSGRFEVLGIAGLRELWAECDA